MIFIAAHPSPPVTWPSRLSATMAALTTIAPKEAAMADRPPLPPFTLETAAQKVQAAEDAWNTCDPERVALAYSKDSVWRNRDTFIRGRAEIITFLTSKWERELDYVLRKNLWCFEENRI